MDPHSQNEGLTNPINGQVYEGLVTRDRQLNLVPALATGWEQTGPLQLALQAAAERQVPRRHAVHGRRRGVLGQPRARSPPRRLSVYANALGTPVAVDALTVEFRLDKVNPIFLQHLTPRSS